MNFKILPLLLAAIISKGVQAQTALTSMSSTLNTSTSRTLIDTIVYKYTPGRGGQPVVENPIYTSQFEILSNMQPQDRVNRDQYVYSGNLSFDSAKNVKTSTMKGIAFFEKEYNTYNSGGLLIKQEQYTDLNSHKTGFYIFGVTKVVTNYSYYTSGSLKTKQVTQYDALGTPLFSGTDSFVYNVSGMPVYVRMGSVPWTPSFTNYYYAGSLLDSIDYGTYYHKFYYTSGILARIKFGMQSSPYGTDDYYTYNIAGKMVSDSCIFTSLAGIASKNKKVEYVYDVQGNPIERLYYHWNLGSSSWGTPFTNAHATYDANNNLLSYYTEIQSGSSSIKELKHVFTYNSSNQITSFSMQSWDAGTSSWVSSGADTQRHYYYGVVTGVDKIPAQQLQCSIYPVPATAMLNVDISNGKENETAFEVYNTSGQLVRRMVVTTQSNGKYTIPVADLSAGTYILHTKNGEMENVKQFAVLR